MRNENDRRRSVLGERLARKGISSVTGADEAALIFERTEKGKPYCVNAKAFFSISHSKDMVACVIDKHEIGTDIEKTRPIEMRITRISCTDTDKSYIFGNGDTDAEGITPDAERLKRFFTLWTAKEAYFKFLGTGIECLKTVSYCDIARFCTTFEIGEYILTVYSTTVDKNAY